MELFGFEINRKKTDVDLGSFVPKSEDDGAVVVAEGGVYGQYVDLEHTSKTEGELVTRYRKMSMQPECENAIDDVVNESIVYCLLYTSPSPRDVEESRMPSSA